MSGHSAIFNGTVMLGTAWSWGTSVCWSQCVMMGLDWPELWGQFLGHSAYFYQVCG